MTRLGLLVIAGLAACATTAPPAGDPPSPVDGPWRLVSLGDTPARSTNAPGPTLTLLPDGRATGNTGCNQYSGPYTLRGDSLGFGPLVSTRRACVDEGMNAQESALMRTLEATRHWRMEGDTLVLLAAPYGAARFVKQ